MVSFMKTQMMVKTLVVACMSFVAWGQAANPCFAGTYVYNGSITTSQGPGNVNVSASFTISGDTLTIDLQNLAATPNTTFILTNLEWTIAGHDTATLAHANGWWTSLGNTHKYNGNGVDSGGIGNDQNQWDFAQPTTALQKSTRSLGSGYNSEYAISTVSSSPGNIFSQIDGLAYGLVGPSTGLGNNTNFDNLILLRNTGSNPSGLEFTLTGLTGISENDITNVLFSFGSPVDNQGGVVFIPAQSPTPGNQDNPEPESWVLMSIGFAGLGWWFRRRTTASPARAASGVA